MGSRVWSRDWRDYELEIGDRCRMKMDDGSDPVEGVVIGRGVAGYYIKMRGDDGHTYEGYSPDCEKMFDDE